MFDTVTGSRMLINGIASPISKQLVKADLELKTILTESDLNLDRGIAKQVLKRAGRSVLQAMVLLPVKAIGKVSNDNELLRLCAATEIIYSAFSIHDGIEDSKMESDREAYTIKNSSATLTGDTLFTAALLIISEIFPRSMLLDVMHLIEKNSYMIIAEEVQKSDFGAKVNYLDSLKRRTAEFSSTFALLGAYASKANMEETAVLEKFSYSLGMTYRIITDNENGKTPFELNDSIKFVKHFTDEAKDAVSSFKDSIYKKSLFKLIEYFSYNGTRLKSRNQMLEVRSQV